MLYIQNESREYDRYMQHYSLQLTSCNKIHINESFVHGMLHGDFLMFFTEGNATVEVAELRRKVAADSFVMIKKNLNFVIESTEGCTVIILELDQKYPIPYLEKDKICVFVNIPEIKNDFQRIYDAHIFRKPIPGFFEASIILLLDKIARYGEGGKNQILFKKCCEYIDQNAERTITAKEIADNIGCSYEHLCRVVRKCSDKTVNSLIGECRIQRIMSLCANTELSAEDIASRLDFGSAELMHKYFRYHSGEALSDYRKRIKNAL